MAGKKQPAPSKGGAAKSTNSISSRTSSRNQKPGSQQAATQTIEKGESEEELSRQQTLLNVFSNTFRDVLGAEDFSSQLQELKAALFNRDFEGAFAREAALDVYAARWSPTRALCYSQVLRGLDSHLKSLASNTSACGDRSHHSPGDNSTQKGEDKHETRNPPSRGGQDESIAKDETESKDSEEPEASPVTIKKGDSEREEETQPLKILAIGGGAAEIVAFADYISSHNASTTSTRVEVTLLDIGPWGSIIQRLQTALTTTPPISRYANTAAREANKPLVASTSFQSNFAQKDILSLNQEELMTLISGPDNNPILITLLFTLNELYTISGIKRTTTFLNLLSALVPRGTLLLVIDSPGSYSEAAVGKEAKRYPMQWLLDHTLVPPPSDSRQKSGDGQENGVPKPDLKWEKIESDDSVWFRVAEGLRYPIPLENMRYQMHLYRASINRP
ncbi:hypothetical protein E0Z10_g3584 [Xylaria hypoxylon]|uniref:25S rRNA (Uridine(2843)-N(3))-methyltransferase n=1 Tax=Xylaria hypoxylon TaxID=37992 RepID=A0A4Z0Z104_9PEZI|nr:hypothetical protein E0Z10_g3584 [Xylaria hypoxylon]